MRAGLAAAFASLPCAPLLHQAVRAKSALLLATRNLQTWLSPFLLHWTLALLNEQRPTPGPYRFGYGRWIHFGGGLHTDQPRSSSIVRGERPDQDSGARGPQKNPASAWLVPFVQWAILVIP